MQRRTFLKGAGVALLLPRMESLGQVDEAKSPRRLLTIVNHLSFYQPELIPKTGGAFEKPPALLAELSDHFKHLKIFSGLDNPAVQNGFGHTPCVGILSGYFNKLHRKNRLSIDQAIADQIGSDTRFKSLVFQAGENLNFSQISWDKHGLPVKQIDSPRRIFNLLFQIDENEKTQQQVLAEDRSILDAVFRQAKSMEKRLNATDRAKMDEYLTSVREVEKTVKRRAYWADRPKPQADYEIENFDRKSVDDYVATLLDLAVLALQTDSTRVVSMSVANCNWGLDGVTDSYHTLSHHGQREDKLTQLAIVEEYLMRNLARFIERLKTTEDHNSRSMLDTTQVLFGSGLGSGSRHSNTDLPLILAGGGWKHGQHIDAGRKQPLCNLYLSMLQRMGAEQDYFNRSRSTFAGLDV